MSAHTVLVAMQLPCNQKCHPRRAPTAGAASLRASSSDVFPAPFLAEALPGTFPELGSDSGSVQASLQRDLRAPAAVDVAARNAAPAPTPAPIPLTKEPLRVNVPNEASGVDAADDKGKKISHKRGRSLSALVPRLMGRRTSATGDELHVSTAGQC